MTSPAITVVDSAAGIRTTAALIALSFDALQANHYLVPDAHRRIEVFTDFFAVMTEHAVAGAGQVLLTEDHTAAAVWFDRTRHHPEADDFAERLEKAVGEFGDRFAELDEALEADHPGDPHWHLAFLAVHPRYQSRGLGGALMTRTHTRLDEQRLPAYLESTNPRNRAGYRRHGYVDMDPPEIVVGDPAAATGSEVTGTVFYRMWREPSAG